MTLQDDALDALRSACRDVGAGAWGASDAAFFAYSAEELAELQASAAATNDADLRDQYTEAATLLKDRIAAEICRRVNNTGKQLLKDACLVALDVALRAVPGLSLFVPPASSM